MPEVSKGSEAADATDDGQSDAAAAAAPDADSGPPTRTRGGSGRDSSRSAASGNAGDESLALSFDVSLGVSGVSLTIEELCGATGLSAAEIAALEGFGLVEPLTVAGGRYYDECALAVAHLVSRFGRYGVEPRHLRLYRNAVDRESGLVEQIVTPLLRQRNPEARQRANDAAAELGTLGQQLRAALLRRELRRLLGG